MKEFNILFAAVSLMLLAMGAYHVFCLIEIIHADKLGATPMPPNPPHASPAPEVCPRCAENSRYAEFGKHIFAITEALSDVATGPDVPRDEALNSYIDAHAKMKARIAVLEKERDELKAESEAAKHLLSVVADAPLKVEILTQRLEASESRAAAAEEKLEAVREAVRSIEFVPMMTHKKDSAYPTCPACGVRNYGSRPEHKAGCAINAILHPSPGEKP